MKFYIRIYYSWCIHLVTVLYRAKLDASLSNGHFIIFTYEIFSITVLSFIAFCFLVVVDKIKKLGVYMLTRNKSFFYGHKISLVFLLLKLSIIPAHFLHIFPLKNKNVYFIFNLFFIIASNNICLCVIFLSYQISGFLA